jgi:transposase
MAGKRAEIAWEEQDTPEALRERYRKEAEGEVCTRLHALWLLRTGWGMEQVAGVVEAHYRTVQRWLGWYRHGGVAEVCTHHGGGHGQPAWLTPEQESAVAEEAAKGAFTTAAEARRWVAQQFGVTYRPKGIYGLLRRVRCRPKVPRPIHTKADLETQEAWKKGAVPQLSRRLE